MDLEKNNEIEILIDNLSSNCYFRLNTRHIELLKTQEIIHFIDIKELYIDKKGNFFVIRKLSLKDDRVTFYTFRYVNYYSMIEDYINLAQLISDYKRRRESFLRDYDFRM